MTRISSSAANSRWNFRPLFGLTNTTRMVPLSLNGRSTESTIQRLFARTSPRCKSRAATRMPSVAIDGTGTHMAKSEIGLTRDDLER
jgi:hypothetical protein